MLTHSVLYKKTLYDVPYASAILFAISTDMGRTPVSISDTRVCVIPKRSASCFCVIPSFVRKPRRAIAGFPSGKTSSMEYSSSPSSLTGREESLASSSKLFIALQRLSAWSLGTVRQISVNAPVVCIFMCANISNLHQFDGSISYFPYSNISGLAFVQMTMVHILFADNFSVMMPVGSFRPQSTKLQFKQVQSIPDVGRQFVFLLASLAGCTHSPVLIIVQGSLLIFLKNKYIHFGYIVNITS